MNMDGSLSCEQEPPGCRPPRLLNPFEDIPAQTGSKAAPPLCGPAATFFSLPAKKRTLTPRIGGGTFRARFHPDASDAQWNDWRWQIRHRILDARSLERVFPLSGEERLALESGTGPLPFAVTPYYAALIDPENASSPLRKCVVPTALEYRLSPGESDDPLHEEGDSPVPGIVHRYPDRVLFLVTNFCSTYCRYCTRSRLVGHDASVGLSRRERWEAGLEYIRSTPSVRDVLLSGGDPLTLEDEDLNWLLSRLRRIPHVEIVRMGTKVPAVLPQRITPELTRMLKRHHPLFASLHFVHPDELTPETMQACGRLADAGIPLGSQTVLLKGVNDDPRVMTKLCQGLLRCRVRPYYLYQCDPIPGSAHFRTPVAAGLDIIENMRGHTTGYAVPTFVIDAPGGGGKIPLLPDHVQGRVPEGLLLTSWNGKTCLYPDIQEENAPCGSWD